MGGFAASPGRARGPVTVFHPDKAPSALSAGTIVVCPVLSRTVLTEHPGSLAFVAEGGGALSLAASQARQAGIPAVAGVDRATATLRDGDVIEVDGSEGTVRILARALS
jgi:pyruvate,water dikinase